MSKILKPLVALIIAVVAVDFFFVHYLFPHKKTELMKSYGDAVDRNLEQNPPAENVNDLSFPKSIPPQELTGTFQSELKKCFPDIIAETPGELLQFLTTQLGVLNSSSEDIQKKRKETILFKNGTRAFIDWMEGHPVNFQVLSATKTLSCAKLSCRCL